MTLVRSLGFTSARTFAKARHPRGADPFMMSIYRAYCARTTALTERLIAEVAEAAGVTRSHVRTLAKEDGIELAVGRANRKAGGR